MLLQEIFRLCPEFGRELVSYIPKEEDPRDYRMDFSKIASVLGYRVTKRVPAGIMELHAMLRSGILSEPDAQRYRNIWSAQKHDSTECSGHFRQ